MVWKDKSAFSRAIITECKSDSLLRNFCNSFWELFSTSLTCSMASFNRLPNEEVPAAAGVGVAASASYVEDRYKL